MGTGLISFYSLEKNHDILSKCFSSCPCHSAPYYFGVTDAYCLTPSRFARRATPLPPRRPVTDLVQRWVYYRGYYAECGIGPMGVGQQPQAVVNQYPVGFNRCRQQREPTPAGFSTVSVDCLRRCVDRYHSTHGSYNFILHSSTRCANEFAKILFNGASDGSCPQWCTVSHDDR